MRQGAQLPSYNNEEEQQAAGILFKLLVAIFIAYLIAIVVGIYYHDMNVIVTLSFGITSLIIPYIFA